MANDFWLPTSSDLRRQCAAKLLETEKDFWMTTNEMLHGMLESIWDSAKNGEAVTIRRGSEKITLSVPSEERL